MTVKERLHELVEELPDGPPSAAAERALSHLKRLREDPVLRALMEAPADDEPETQEEKASVAEGHAAIARGDVLTDEELRDELGL